MDQSQNPQTQGRRGSLRLQTRGMLGQNGGPNAGNGLPQSNGGNSSTMDLSSSARPPPVTSSARSSGLL